MQINNTISNSQNINNNSQNPNFKGAGLRGAFRTLANPDALATTVLLEGGVSSGRSINAYKRGGFPEMRERLTDDLLAAVFWMKGVDIFNKIADKVVGEKILHLKTTEFDVGKDLLRAPFENIVAEQGKEMSKTLSTYKFTKVFASTALAVGFVGFILPKINQWITKQMMSKQHKKEAAQNSFNLLKNNTIEDFSKVIEEKSKNRNENPSFGNGLTTAAFLLENNAICKMMSSDVGILSGRMLTARNKDEAIEYGFRDASSSFFYYASTPLLYGLFQKLSGSKKATSIDPVAAQQLTKNAKDALKGGKMQADEFANATMGALSERAKKFIGDLKFETAKPSLIQKLFNKTNNDIAVISVDDLVGSLGEEASNAIGMTKETLKTKAEAMSKALQPAKNGKMLLTRQQVSDLFKDGSINSSEFMGEIYGSKFKELLNPNKFISIKKITKFRNNMDDYLNAMADYAKKKNNGEVTAELIEKFSKSSFVKSAAFRGTAILISALCLGIAIPKLQYAITKKRTGNDKAPGLREYENSGNTKENNTQKA